MSTVTEETSEVTEPKTNKWVYLFDEGPGDDKALLGGKGAGLCEMTQAGLPVPPGLVVTTEACNAFFENDKNFPEGMWEQVKEGLKILDEVLVIVDKTGARVHEAELYRLRGELMLAQSGVQMRE